jgi:hypothetical protein
MNRAAEAAGTRPIWMGQERDCNIAEAGRANGKQSIYCEFDATVACRASCAALHVALQAHRMICQVQFASSRNDRLDR